MPPRRKRVKATKETTEEQAEDAPRPQPKPKATRRRVRLPQLPIELWRMIVKEACLYPLEMDYSENSPRAMAALGYHDVCTFNYTRGMDARRLAYQTRRTIVLVNKVWWALGQEHLYHTIFISESSRPLFADLLGQFLRRPEIGPRVRRLELNFEITKESVDAAGTLLRGFIKNCPNLEVIDDHVTRKITSETKRAASPILIAPQAAGEIPFAIALGNKQTKTLKHLNFSQGSTAAFTYKWSANLLNRFENLQILSLHEFPGWQKLPVPLSPQEEQERRERARRRREQARRRYRSYSDEEEEEEEEDADDEFTPPQPIKLPHLHTLDISRLPNIDKPMARALTHWLKSWEIPAVSQLGLSIYNFESIPFPLLHQVAPTLKLLVLHHFSVKYVRTTQTAPGGGSTADTQAQAQATTRVDPLQGKAIEFPELERILVTGAGVVPDWNRLFDCPKLGTYCIQWHSYQPTPYNPLSNGLESPTPVWSTREKMQAHLKAAYQSMPRLVAFQVVDLPFKSMEISDDDIRFWRAMERDLKKRKISVLGAEAIPWNNCRPKDEAEQLKKRKEEAEKAAAEKAAAEKATAEKAEADKLAAEKAEADKLEAEKAEAERLAAEKAAAETETQAPETAIAVEESQREGEPLSQETNSGDSGPGESQGSAIHVPEGQDTNGAPNPNVHTQETEATPNNPNGDPSGGPSASS